MLSLITFVPLHLKRLYLKSRERERESHSKGQFTPGIKLARYIWDLENNNYY